MDFDLSGQVVAVTGASSGIGEATALAAARAGAAVALAARRVDRIDALAARIEADGGRALAIEADLGVEEQARAFITRTAAELGRIDALVNNAGLMLLGPVAGADTEEWRRMVDVNLYGVLYCTHAAVPIMLEQGSGHVVIVSSIAGRKANAGAAVYGMTKFGIGAFAEALRQEVTASGVRVTLVEPGAVVTELAAQNRPEVRTAIEERLGEFPNLEAADLANAIIYALALPATVSVSEMVVRPTGQVF